MKSVKELYEEALADIRLEDDLDEALANHNSKEIKWHNLYAEANARYKAAKNKVEKLKAELALQLRSGKIKVDFKVTDTTAQQWALCNPQVQKLIRQLIKAEHVKVFLDGAKKDFEDRKDILISLSANFRSELDHDIYLVKKAKEVNPSLSFNPKHDKKTQGGN